MFRKINGLFLLAFLLSTLVQFNDPDALLWIAIYSCATLLCLLEHLGKHVRPFALGLAGLGLVGMLLLILEIPSAIPWSDVFASLAMRSDAVEEAREIGGLALVVVWMLALGTRKKKAKGN